MIVLAAPKRWLTSIVIFGGILSHSGADVGYVLMYPLLAVGLLLLPQRRWGWRARTILSLDGATVVGAPEAAAGAPSVAERVGPQRAREAVEVLG